MKRNDDSKSIANANERDIIKERTSLVRNDGKYELPKFEDDIKCPICGADKAFTLNRTIYHLPDGDDVLIILMECKKCHFKSRDVINLYTSFKPGEYRLIIDDGDFTHKIFRGSHGVLSIEEIGVEIERGEGARFEYTNVEGILMRIEEQLNFFIQTTPENDPAWRNANEAKKRLERCKSGKMPFTITLKDPIGGSYIVPSSEDKLSFTPYEENNANNNNNRN